MTLHPSAPAGALLSLPPPVMAQADLLDLLARHWGLSGRLLPLGSERDLNHRLSTAVGRFLVKLSHGAEPLGLTAFQIGALQHVAQADPDLPIARHVPCTDGADFVDTAQGRLRVLTWLEGASLATAPRSDVQRQAVGAALGRLTRALQGYRHPAADHGLLWDIRQMPRLAALLPALPDPDLAEQAATAIADFEGRLAPVLARLPAQVCHADFNPSNLLVAPEQPDQLTGILDFGDMVQTPRICDLAVAASYQIDQARPLDSLSALLRGYARFQQLGQTELVLLYDLILARMLTTRVIAAWRAARHPENAAYILRNVPASVLGERALRGAGRDAAGAAFAQAPGMGA